MLSPPVVPGNNSKFQDLEDAGQWSLASAGDAYLSLPWSPESHFADYPTLSFSPLPPEGSGVQPGAGVTMIPAAPRESTTDNKDPSTGSQNFVDKAQRPGLASSHPAQNEKPTTANTITVAIPTQTSQPPQPDSETNGSTSTSRPQYTWMTPCTTVFPADVVEDAITSANKVSQMRRYTAYFTIACLRV